MHDAAIVVVLRRVRFEVGNVAMGAGMLDAIRRIDLHRRRRIARRKRVGDRLVQLRFFGIRHRTSPWWVAFRCYANGSRNTMFSLRSGPVDTIAIGHSTSSSSERRYARAAAGSFANSVMPRVDSVQPWNSR